MNHDSQQPEVSTNRFDAASSIAKVVLGAAPFVGPLLAEIVGHVIPNQRIDRIAEFVRLLDQRLQDLEKDVVQNQMQEPTGVDLMEDAFSQAARATTQERIEHIANVVANGISAEEQNHAEAKRMLWLLGQLNDAEVILLRSSLAMTIADYERDADFHERHSQLLAPDATHLRSTDDELEEAALKASYRQHLHDLGLIRQRFRKPKRGDFPEFDDETGMMKASGSDVTRLGKMFLRYLDLIPDWYR